MGGERLDQPNLSPSKMFLSFYLSLQSFGLCNPLNVSEHFWMTYSKVRIKFSNLQHYWYFYFVGWGKTGPAHSFPPPKCLNLSIYCLVFWFILLFDCIWTILNNLFQREIKFLNQQVTCNWYFYIVVWGKTGPAHSFPPPNWSDLAIYLLDFWIMLFFCCIWTLLTYTKQWIKFSNQQVYL